MNRPLLEELQRYPQSWSLTPTNGNKQPYRKRWQTEKPLERNAIAADIINGNALGVGLRSGSVSGGILCVDFDGHSALIKWLEMSGGAIPPLTNGWTSGREGRFQLAYQVPCGYWDEIKSRKIPTAWDDNGKPTEYLEIRWDGLQSILPPSAHPSTAGYSWLPGQAPWECEIALIPEFLIEAAKLESKQQPPERIASNPTDNPWDIRNFTRYLDGYQLNGRHGWDTCKCPAHNGQSDDSLHIKQSTGGYKCQANCDSKEIYHAALELAKSRGYQLPEKRMGHSFSGLFGWLPRFKQRLEKSRKIPWGFGRKGEVEVEPTPVKTLPGIKFQPGQQQEVYAEAHKQGYKYILDSSPTSSGKSYNAGLLKPEQFELQQLMYVSNEHRNPTTNTLKDWDDLEARHDGLVRDEFDKLRRRTDKSQPYVVQPNCGRNNTISALRSKNIDGADTAGVVCNFCPQHEKCGAGVVFGFLNQRAVTLKSPRLRTHPASLPSSDTNGDAPYDYSSTGLIWDEADEIFKAHRSIEVRESDIKNTMNNLLLKLPEFFDILRPLLILLCFYLSGQVKAPNKYGLGTLQSRKALPIPNGIDVKAIRDALKPDLSFLNTTAEHGEDLDKLPSQVRKKFTDSDAAAAEKIGQRIELNWLSDFLDVLMGNVHGALRIQKGILTITLPDQRLRETSQAAALNIYMDATATPEDLALKLGCNPSEILHVRQVTPDTSNLEIIQVANMGRLGLVQRSEFCKKRINALISKIQQDAPGETAVIDFKRHNEKGDGKRGWWADTRGINDLERYTNIIAIGTPCPNLSELEAEFTVLFGRSPREGAVQVKYPIQVLGTPSPDLQPYFEMDVSADPEFREFVRRKILASYHQMIGRLRAHRRPGEQLRVYIIADYPLDIPVRLVKASEITPEAATKTERMEMAICGAVQLLEANKQKVTQAAVAAITGFSQQHISRFKNLLISLLENSNSKMSKTGDPPPDPDEMQWMGREHLPMLAESPSSELLEGVQTVFEVYDHKVWRQIWDLVPAAAQVKILQALVLALPSGEFRALAAVTQ